MDPILKFTVNNQRIYREDNFHVVAGSKNYLKASFEFKTPEWYGKTKTAVFHADKPYSVVLVNDTCEVPWEFTAEPGDKYISVFAGDLITANKAKVEVWESGYKEGETPEPPTPSAYEQFVSLVEEIGDKASKSAGQAEQSAVSASDSSDRAVAAAEAAAQSQEHASKSASNAVISEKNAKKSENATGIAASEIVADREQIKTNKCDIDELKSDLSSQVKGIHDILGAKKIGKNLLNPATVTRGQNFYTDGSIITSSDYSMSDYIPVKPGQTLAFQGKNIADGTVKLRGMRYVVAYNGSGNVLEIVENATTYTVPELATKIRFSFLIYYTEVEKEPMLFYGTEVTDFEEYNDDVSVNCYIPLEKVLGFGVDESLSIQGMAADAKAVGDRFQTEIVKSRNLLNIDTVTKNQNFDPNGGIITSSNYAMSDYIPVQQGQVLILQAYNKEENKTKILGFRYVISYNGAGEILDISQNIVREYTVPAGAASIRFTFYVCYASADKKPMLFEGKEVTEYEEYAETEVYNFKVNAKNVVGLKSMMEEGTNKYFFRNVDSVCASYSNNATKVTMANHNSVDAVYSMYDALVVAYPDYVTKTLVGTIETESLPIYRYDFTPKLPQNSKMQRLCKILYCSGIHGGEYHPILVGIRFFKDLCENWRTQELLKTLRFNCHFTVVPIVNPYGFVHSTRQNENRVDLNRNFANGWHNRNNYVVGDTNYPGASPASEISTQLIETMIATEPFDFGLDHHTYDTYINSGKSGYFVGCTQRPEDISFSDMLGVWMNAKTMADNSLITDFSKSHFQTLNQSGFDGYFYGAFPNGFCFENMSEWGSAEMESVYDSQKFNAETIGAIFYSAFVGYHTY